MDKLSGRVALVTGASRGIGLAIAKAFSHEGATVVLVARSRGPLERAKDKLAGRREAVAADVRRPADVRKLFARLRRRYGRLDILVNNAGVFTYKPLAKTTLKDWQQNIETNLTSLFLTAQAALPLLARSRIGHVVNILSISSRRAFANCSAYTAAKFGALGFTRVLRQELRSRGIRVTAVLPGLTNTSMVEAFGGRVPLAKILQPEDVADAVLGAVLQPTRSTVEEILLMPSCGAL